MMNAKSLIKDTLIYGSGNLICRAISFFVFPLYTYVLTTSDFGTMELVNTGAGIISVIINLGLNSSLQRFYYDTGTDKYEQRVLVSTGLYCMGIFGLGILLIAICITYILKDFFYYEYSIAWLWILIALINVYVSQHMYYCMDIMRLHFKSQQFALISSMSSLLTVIFCLIYLFYLKLGIMGYFLSSLIAATIMTIVAIYFIRSDLVLCFDLTWCKKLIKYGFPMVGAAISYFALSAVDRIMLSFYVDVSEIGLYSVGFKFANIILFINNAAVQAWLPYCMKMYSDDKYYKQKIATMYSYYISALSLLAAAISIFSKEILMLTVSMEFWQASNILSILVIGTVVYASTQYSAVGINFEKKTKFVMYVSLFVLFINIISNMIFIPYLGAVGAAVGMLISYLVMTLMYFFITYKIHYIPFSKIVNIYCFFSLICSVILGNIMPLENIDIYNIFIKLFVLLCMFFPIMYALYRKYRIEQLKTN